MSTGLAGLLRQTYERFNAPETEGEFDPEVIAPEFWERLADDVEVHEPDDAPEPRVFVGREGYKAATRETIEAFEGLRYEVRRIIEVGNHLIVLVRASGRERQSGTGREVHEVHLWTVREGRLARVQGFHSVDDALRVADELDAGETG